MCFLILKGTHYNGMRQKSSNWNVNHSERMACIHVLLGKFKAESLYSEYMVYFDYINE